MRLSCSDMDEEAACTAARNAEVVIQVQPVYIPFSAAADWQRYPVQKQCHVQATTE